MQSQIEHPMDEATYARLAEESETRLEWIGGQIVAMAGASRTHNKMSTRVATAINNQNPDGECEATVGDLRVHVEATSENFYPDVVVACDDAKWHETLPHTLLNPVVVVEVLSPTTQKKDQENKVTAYKRIPSLRHYLLISQERVMIYHYSRIDEANWNFSDYYWRRENVNLTPLGVSLSLEEIYRNLNVPEGLTLVPMPQDSE